MRIHSLVAKNDVDSLKNHLLAGGSADGRDAKGKTFLMIACERGHGNIVKYLISLHADPMLSDNHGATALHYAISSGSGELADIMLPISNVSARTLFGWTPLMFAAIRGDVPLLEKLLAKGASANDVDGGGRNALMKAVRNNRPEAVSCLAPKTIIDAADVDGDTALIKAARYGYAPIARILLSCGADPAIRESVKREDALEKAIKHGHIEIQELLRSALMNRLAGNPESP